MALSNDMASGLGRINKKRRRFAAMLAAGWIGSDVFTDALASAVELADVITPDMVAVAEKAAGLSLTDSDRKKVADSLTGLLKAYESLRTTALPNDVPPAVVFSPLTVGVALPSETSSVVVSPVDPAMPADIDELAFSPVTHLAKLIETRKVTSTALTLMYLARLKKYNPLLNCVVTLTEERALEQAARADRDIAAGRYRGFLHGIPWGVKDLFAVKGYPTTWGTGCYRDRVIDCDAAVVERLDTAGAVLVAKLATGRFASGATWFGGVTKSPWNTEKESGGSSAGPGSATAAGCVAFAVGTETRGSIASPSEHCGVTGLRPTFGRVSRFGTMALAWSMDKVGPLCRTAEDCAVVLDAVRGADPYDGSSVDISFVYDYRFDVRKLRLGYVKQEFDGSIDSPGDRARVNNKQYREALDIVKNLGVTLVPIELPPFPPELAYLVLCTEATAALDYENIAMADLKEDTGEPVKRYVDYRFVPATEYLQANRYRMLAIRRMAAVMADVDAYISPTFVGPTNYLTNMTGHPEIIVPCGFDKEGMPISVSFVGRLYREGDIVSLARAFQNATGFVYKHPPL